MGADEPGRQRAGGVAPQRRGRAVQVDPMKPRLKAPGAKQLKLKCDILLSTSAFKFNVRRYSEGTTLWAVRGGGAGVDNLHAVATVGRRLYTVEAGTTCASCDVVAGRGLHSSTSQLNLSALYGIGGARKGCVARVKGVLGGA